MCIATLELSDELKLCLLHFLTIYYHQLVQKLITIVQLPMNLLFIKIVYLEIICAHTRRIYINIIPITLNWYD